MKVEMNRLSNEVTISGIAPKVSVSMKFETGKPITEKTNKDGIVIFDLSKEIPKNLRKEVIITVKEKGKSDMEHIYEIRKTKLIEKRVIEVRKEK